MKAIAVTFIACICILVRVAFALSPPPGGWVPTTLDALWRDSDRALHGEVIAMRLIEGSDMRREYVATLRVAKVWKGSVGDELEIRLMIARGDGMGYTFKIGDSYVLFIKDVGDGVVLRYARPFSLEASGHERAFGQLGSGGTYEDLPGGGRLADEMSLRQFLESKDPE